MSHFGEAVKRLREELDLSQDELAHRADISRSLLQQAEGSAVPKIRGRSYRKLAKGLGLTEEQLDSAWGHTQHARAGEKKYSSIAVEIEDANQFSRLLTPTSMHPARVIHRLNEYFRTRPGLGLIIVRGEPLVDGMDAKALIAAFLSTAPTAQAAALRALAADNRDAFQKLAGMVNEVIASEEFKGEARAAERPLALTLAPAQQGEDGGEGQQVQTQTAGDAGAKAGLEPGQLPPGTPPFRIPAGKAVRRPAAKPENKPKGGR